MYSKIKIIIFGNIFLTVLLTAIGIAVAADNDNSVKLLGNYHLKVNEIVNQKVSDFYSFFDEVKLSLNNNNTEILAEIQANLLPPSEVNADTCKSNLSSTCLTYLLNIEYQTTASEVIQNLETIQEIPEGSTLTKIGSSSEQKRQFIIDELRNARMATENTVEFYRQFIFAYPLHIEFEMTAANLKKLKGEIKKFSNTLETYPSKFHDATTVQCL